MKKECFAERFGHRWAELYSDEENNEYTLFVFDRHDCFGTIIHEKTYGSYRGAKIALGMLGHRWW